MENIVITKVEISDLEKLQRIAKKTFFDTFAPYNTAENMEKYLNENFSEDTVLSELKNTDSEFYFAMYLGDVVGYLKVNFGPAQTEMQDNNSLEIERIYVLQDYLGKKVGQVLYHKALEIAENKNLQYVWLGVWEENQRAVQFYKKNGFTEFDKHIFKFGDEEQTDLMMRKNLI
ncbi:N-acetyltransferase family protein [Chryseobacterium sp. 2TAF14]|uniref:GNAT family N-acetyltransferase n=1 Tax=Chryseobacterium sp. 2TAF14 TaxID=3233007 RepID=UPI003F90B9E5